MGSLSAATMLNTRHLYLNTLLNVHPRAAQRFFSATALPKFGLTVRCCERPSTTKVGRIGQDRFKEGALPGTYWKAKPESELGEEVLLMFNKDSKTVTTSARSGENLLQVAERCGMMIPNTAGRQGSSDLVRSCLCPVPAGRASIDINVFDDDGM